MNGSHETTRPLKVLIVGAGIGGLTAAIALRRQGHDVELFETAAAANEAGAAINMVPNASSVLQRLGVDVRDSGAVVMESMRLLKSHGQLLEDRNMLEKAHRWQSGWYMTHRAHLHELLRCTATSKDGVGRPAKLHFSSRVDSIDADSATISFEDGSNAQGDVILGADGVHSVTRSVISSDIKAQASHHSAFRFLVSREAAMKDSRTTEYFLRTGCMELWYSEDKKIVCYPCANNQVFNFVCIHPASLSNASESYDKSANKEVLLDIFKDFDPAAVAMLEKADTDSLKIYPLFDMLTLPTYVKGRLALIGDAAHPFLPHLAQGGAMAIEDGVSLGVMLAAGTPISEVPRRLQLYNNARYARATLVQRYTRIVGGDGIKKEEVSTEKLTLNDYLEYGCSHDEYHASKALFLQRQWSQQPRSSWRNPIAFGPMPGPRQNHEGHRWRHGLEKATCRTASITFKTSATLLRALLPTTAYSFVARDTVAYASFRLQKLDNLPWLGGTGYNLLGLYLHNVQYKAANGTMTEGSFIPLMVEDLADPIISGREQLGFPKVFSEIDVEDQGDTFTAKLSWRGRTWCTLQLPGLREQPNATNENTVAESILVHKYVPGTGPEVDVPPDADYAVVIPSDGDVKTSTTKRRSSLSTSSSIAFDSLDWQRLPTLHHIVSRLADVPIFEIVEATVVDANGVPDLAGAKRVET